MSSKPDIAREHWRPADIGAGAAEHLRYIRNTIETTQTFTAVPGRGCVAMGLVALAAGTLETVPALAAHWLTIWLSAAAIAGVLAFLYMCSKARRLGLSLTRTAARRFFLTLIPVFAAAAILTYAAMGTNNRSLIAAIWLLLYGAGLTSGGMFSVPAVRWAGLGLMTLGALAAFLSDGAAPVLLVLGFGGLHIALGLVIERRHGG